MRRVMVVTLCLMEETLPLQTVDKSLAPWLTLCTVHHLLEPPRPCSWIVRMSPFSVFEAMLTYACMTSHCQTHAGLSHAAFGIACRLRLQVLRQPLPSAISSAGLRSKRVV